MGVLIKGGSFLFGCWDRCYAGGCLAPGSGRPIGPGFPGRPRCRPGRVGQRARHGKAKGQSSAPFCQPAPAVPATTAGSRRAGHAERRHRPERSWRPLLLGAELPGNRVKARRERGSALTRPAARSARAQRTQSPPSAAASSYNATPRRNRTAVRMIVANSRRVGVWAARNLANPARTASDSSEPSGQALDWRTAAS